MGKAMKGAEQSRPFSEGFVTAMGKGFRASQVSILLKRYNLK